MAADEEEKAVLNTPFLNPPSFWQSFTTENIEAYRILTAEVTESSLAIPKELENLKPPAPPNDGHYSTFGEKHSLDAPLKDLPEEIPVLRSGTEKNASPQHLLNLTRSLMLSYLEMLHIMAINPAPPIYGIKWEDLRALFRNALQGVNSYRPWQARNALIKLLERTRDDARAEIAEIQGLQIKVDETLGQVMQNCEEIAITSEEKSDNDGDAMNGVERSHDLANAAKINGTTHVSEANQQSKTLWNLINKDSDE